MLNIFNFAISVIHLEGAPLEMKYDWLIIYASFIYSFHLADN